VISDITVFSLAFSSIESIHSQDISTNEYRASERFSFEGLSMMIILRIFPNGDLDGGWDAVLRNLDKLGNDQCTPLYLSQQEERSFMSIIYDLKDLDSFTDVLVKNIPSVLHPAKTRTITLLSPVFFPVPKDRPGNLERYQVSTKVRSDKLEDIFDDIVHLKYPRDVLPTYAAYSFGEDDILASFLSVSRDRINTFLRDNVEPRRGVLSVEAARIDNSKRLAPIEMWRRYRESRYAFKPTGQYEEYDFTELAALTGAFVHEIGAD
jgi:hypothetical protein